MKPIKSKKLRSKKSKFTGPKWVMFGLVMGVVLATVGSVAALNGWFGGGGSIPEDTFTRGLVGYWGFEEGSGSVTYDASDYSNDGTLYWMSTSSDAWTSGKVGGALEFDGTDDYVEVSNTASLDLGSDDFTIEAWVRFDSFYNWVRFLNKSTSNYQGILINAGAAGTIHFLASDTGSSWPINITSASTFSTDTWYHIVALRSGSDFILYVNASNEGSGTASMTLPNHDVNIGRSTYLTTNFDGRMDEVRIYNRALSPAEIRYHYNRGGPVGHWKMNEGSGSTAYDSTTNDNDGTLYGEMATSTTFGWVSGKHGSALNFDGTDDYVDVGTNIANSNLPLGDNMTFETWIKGGTQAGGLITMLNKNWAIRFGIRDNSYFETGVYNDTGGIISDVQTAAGTYVANAWMHIVYTHDTSNDKFYINGSLSKSETSSFTTVMEENANTLTIANSSEGFKGIIDDVRIYNYARTAEQIRQDYNAGLSAHFK